MAFAKIWTEARGDSKFLSLSALSRGIFLQLIIACKSQLDDGYVRYRNWSAAGSDWGCDGRTAYTVTAKLHEICLVVLRKDENGTIEIFLPNYIKWQEITAKDVVVEKRKSTAKLHENCSLLEQIRLEQKEDSCKQAKKTVNPDHQKIIQYWSDKYFDRYGTKYVFKGGKDGTAIKRLLGAWGFDALRRLIDQLFVSTDPFYESGGGRTIGVLSANDNKLAQEMLAPHRAQIPQRVLNNLKEGAAWLLEQERSEKIVMEITDESDGQGRLRSQTE